MMRAYKAEEIELAGDGISQKARAVEVEQSLERLGWLLDDLFRIPGLGWRVGLDALVGLIPGVGDTATTLASLYILTSAVRYRVPKVTLLRMGPGSRRPPAHPHPCCAGEVLVHSPPAGQRPEAGYSPSSFQETNPTCTPTGPRSKPWRRTAAATGRPDSEPSSSRDRPWKYFVAAMSRS